MKNRTVGKVGLRSVELGDLPYFHAWFSNHEVMRYFGQEILDISLTELKKYFSDLLKNRLPEVFFVITLNNKPVGGIGAELHEFNKTAEFWVLIGDKKAWGKGIGFTASKKVIDYLFKKKKYNRVELTVTPGLKNGIHLYQKLGFKTEGTKRKSEWNKIVGEFEDEIMMSVLINEWK